MDVETLVGSADAAKKNLSVPLRFGLGAGLYFEYFRRPQESPSHFIVGFNRNLDTHLATRIAAFQNGDTRQVVRAALRENALWFNLDRAPTTALLGMEMLAEQLADFARIPNWRTCLNDMREEITATGSCYRRVYWLFLKEIQSLVETEKLCRELSEIADEWDALAAQFARARNDAFQLERASSLLRRLAFREEHFWGKVLDL
ncbi:MAG: DUF4872 domain-containing protein [Chloroflexi bacterium]|nr:DUF4872 domain-containing protein [Chloroflexota bacterium]